MQDTQRIRPGHVAVLVRTHRNAALIRDALDEVDIPAVINGAGSVFGTAPARDWLRLLEAIERPSSPARAASAALTPFLGWTTERVASATEEDREELHRRLHQWARVLRVKGVASLTETVTLVEGLPAARAADHRRRARADRPAPRRPAPARRGDDRADGRRRADLVAAPADRRRRRGHERRGAQPPPRVRRRGGPGPHHPPQQGRRVPDRLLPLPVGAGLDPATTPSRSSSTTRRPATSASSTSAWTAPTSPPTSASTRPSSAARTCGSPTSR